MNVSKFNNPICFKSNDENLFKVQTYEYGLPSKISGLLKFDNGEFSIRFCSDWILCVGNGSMLIWKYSSNKKNAITSCIEYQIPHCTSGHKAKQILIMKSMDTIIVTNDGHVRYWPRLNMPLEYLDEHIQGLNNDECLIIKELSEGAVVAVFRSMKIVIIDIRDASESGINIKIFTQPRGFINGMGRYLQSFIVSSVNSEDHFKNIKVNNSLPEETEILIMADNSIDILSVDVLYNGQYKKDILHHDLLKKEIFKVLFFESGINENELSLVLENFDICHNIIYVLIRVQSRDSSAYVLLTYNRKMSAIDSVVIVDVDFDGGAELSVNVDESAANDEPCLLVSLKDNHNIYVVEVLTGTVKCELNTEHCAKVAKQLQTHGTIVGWTCPNLSQDPDIIMIALTVSKQLVAIKQNINPLANQSFLGHRRGDTELDFNLSNASLCDWNLSKMSPLRPIALSSPKGDLNASLNRTDLLNASMTTIGSVDIICQDTSAFGTFKKSVVLYWLGYKSQAKRVLAPILERANLNSDISLPLFVLHIVREIIDEYPGKDPRWTAVINSQDTKGFLYSNKSLLLPQQLQAKKESLQKLILMLKENNVDLFGPLGNVAPMSVCQSLYMQISGSMLKSFGCGQVTWSLAHTIGFGVELLEFVRIFSEIMASENGDEINQILARCCQHVLALQRKLTPIDILCQEVSLIPRFVRDCSDYLKEKPFADKDANEIRTIYTLLAKIISGCLKSSLLSRTSFQDNFLSVTFRHDEACAASVAAACWITENQPIGVLDSLVDIVISLLHFAGSTDYHVFESAVDVTTVLFDCFKYRLAWMEQRNCNEDEFKRLDDVFVRIRSQIIEKIVDVNDHLDTALSLADKFADFNWLTSICEMLDNKSESRDSCHLEPYLKKWSGDGLSEFVLDWYQDRLKDVEPKSQGKLLAKIQTILEKIQKVEGTNASTKMDTSSGSQVIGKFLEKAEVQRTRWLHDIETGEFSQAAVSLVRLAEAEELSLARRKTLLGLAKLSYLAEMDVSVDAAVEVVNEYLELVRFQEDIPAAVIEARLALAPDAGRQPVIAVQQMVKLYLGAGGNGGTEHYFVRALQLLDFVRGNGAVCHLAESEWCQLLTEVWTEVIRRDEWTAMSLDTACQSSVLAKVHEMAFDRGLSMDVLRPDLDKLFENENGCSSDVEYLVRGAFEAIVGVKADEDVLDSEEEEMNCD